MSKPEKIFDGLLVLQCQNGQKKAFSLLVNRWHAKLCNQAYFYTKDIDTAKDIAQESWRIIIKKIHRLKEPNNFGAWALTIVNRKAIDWLRYQKRNREKFKVYHQNIQADYDRRIAENTIKDNHIDTDKNTADIILKTIKKLPENQQIILRLFYVEDYSIREIAAILTLSKGTVKSRLFYAREKLKHHLNLFKRKTN